MSVGTSELSEYQLELLAKKGLDKAPKNEKLMPYLGHHRREVIQLRLLRFYMEVLGVRVEEVYSIALFGCRAFMSPFIRECYERRLEFKRQGRKLQADVVKLTMNVQYGKSVQNQERFVRSWVCLDVEEFGRRSAGPRMVDLHASPIGHGGFFGIVDELTPGGSLLKTLPQVGTFVLDEARLGIMRNYYHMKLVFDGCLTKACEEARPQSERSKVQIIYTDTDSVIVLIHSETHPSYQLALENFNPESPCFWDILGDVKDYEKAMEYLQSIGVDPDSAQLAFERRGCLGGFGDENAPLTMMEVVCLGPKSYSELLADGGGELRHKNKIKGIDKDNRKTLTHDEYREVLTKTGLGRSIKSHRFESKQHVVHLVENEVGPHAVLEAAVVHVLGVEKALLTDTKVRRQLLPAATDVCNAGGEGDVGRELARAREDVDPQHADKVPPAVGVAIGLLHVVVVRRLRLAQEPAKPLCGVGQRHAWSWRQRHADLLHLWMLHSVHHRGL